MKESHTFAALRTDIQLKSSEVGGGKHVTGKARRWLSFMTLTVINGTIRERQYLVAIYYHRNGTADSEKLPQLPF